MATYEMMKRTIIRQKASGSFEQVGLAGKAGCLYAL